VIQTAVGMQLLPQDYAFYYRDLRDVAGNRHEAYDLRCIAKKKPIHFQVVPIMRNPSLNDIDKNLKSDQSSATGMVRQLSMMECTCERAEISHRKQQTAFGGLHLETTHQMQNQ
jgi:hypothetical protein